jgi:hypothetical protein
LPRRRLHVACGGSDECVAGALPALAVVLLNVGTSFVRLERSCVVGAAGGVGVQLRSDGALCAAWPDAHAELALHCRSVAAMSTEHDLWLRQLPAGSTHCSSAAWLRRWQLQRASRLQLLLPRCPLSDANLQSKGAHSLVPAVAAALAPTSLAQSACCWRCVRMLSWSWLRQMHTGLPAESCLRDLDAHRQAQQSCCAWRLLAHAQAALACSRMVSGRVGKARCGGSGRAGGGSDVTRPRLCTRTLLRAGLALLVSPLPCAWFPPRCHALVAPVALWAPMPNGSCVRP